MYPFNKLIDFITETDLVGLVGSSESNHIDFKKAPYPKHTPPNQDGWRVEFLKDIAAFANASGGWIVCGMDEVDGVATDLCGLGVNTDPEREIMRLEQCANVGVEPRIPGLIMRAVPLSDQSKKAPIVIRIPKSYAAPHWVKQTLRFPVRRSTEVIDMNLEELRAAFNLSENWVANIRRFRRERLEALNAGDMETIPAALHGAALYVVHVIPLTFADMTRNVDLPSNVNQINWPRYYYQFTRQFNFDGFLLREPVGGQEAVGEYIQVFRSGAVECVRCPILPNSEKRIDLSYAEKHLSEQLTLALTAQKALSVEPPLAVMVSATGLAGYTIQRGWCDPVVARSYSGSAPRNTLVFPEVMIESYPALYPANDTSVGNILKPVFDMLWNAAGFARADSYDQNDDWKGKDFLFR